MSEMPTTQDKAHDAYLAYGAFVQATDPENVSLLDQARRPLATGLLALSLMPALSALEGSRAFAEGGPTSDIAAQTYTSQNGAQRIYVIAPGENSLSIPLGNHEDPVKFILDNNRNPALRDPARLRVGDHVVVTNDTCKVGTEIKQPGDTNYATSDEAFANANHGKKPSEVPDGACVVTPNALFQRDYPVVVTGNRNGAQITVNQLEEDAKQVFEIFAEQAHAKAAAEAAVAAEAPKAIYIPKPGDTFSQLAESHGLSTEQLHALNPQIKNINLIIAGITHINVPTNVAAAPEPAPVNAPAAPQSSPEVPTPAPYSVTAPESAPTTAPAPDQTPGKYYVIVQPDYGLDQVAHAAAKATGQSFDKMRAAIKKASHIDESKFTQAGTHWIIPGANAKDLNKVLDTLKSPQPRIAVVPPPSTTTAAPNKSNESTDHAHRTKKDNKVTAQTAAPSTSTTVAHAPKAAATESDPLTRTYTVESDITVKSGVTAAQLNKALEGTPLAGYGDAFIQGEQKYGVSALFFKSLADEESDHGRSEIARVKHNLFGIGAYDNCPMDCAWSYPSFAEGIDAAMKWFSGPDGYLQNGKHFGGSTTPRGVFEGPVAGGHNYSTAAIHEADTVVEIMNETLQKIRS